MQKRGQVSIFVIIGIIVIIAAAILFLLRGNLIQKGKQEINNQEFLSTELKSIQKEILNKCTEKYLKESIKKYTENGASLKEPTNYIKYAGRKYRILCQKIPDTNKCLMEPILSNVLAQQLDEYLTTQVNLCINLDDYKNKGYEIITPTKAEVKTTITKDVITAETIYPLKLKKQEATLNTEGATYRIELPIGDLQNVVNQILKQEAQGIKFDPLTFDILNLNKYIVTVEKPYPDILYTVSLTDNQEYKIYFAIEGQGRYPRIEGRRA